MAHHPALEQCRCRPTQPPARGATLAATAFASPPLYRYRGLRPAASSARSRPHASTAFAHGSPPRAGRVVSPAEETTLRCKTYTHPRRLVTAGGTGSTLADSPASDPGQYEEPGHQHRE